MAKRPHWLNLITSICKWENKYYIMFIAASGPRNSSPKWGKTSTIKKGNKERLTTRAAGVEDVERITVHQLRGSGKNQKSYYGDTPGQYAANLRRRHIKAI